MGEPCLYYWPCSKADQTTPLTAKREREFNSLGIGLRGVGLEFTRAYSSDSGRAIQTMGIILDELGERPDHLSF